jgi:uncharacterized protein
MLIGSALMIGSLVARRVVERIGVHTQDILVDVVLALGAATMVLAIVR